MHFRPIGESATRPARRRVRSPEWLRRTRKEIFSAAERFTGQNRLWVSVPGIFENFDREISYRAMTGRKAGKQEPNS
jgi:hypothetical protein